MSSELVGEVQSASDPTAPVGDISGRSIWPIAGGKGGTGKSTLAANLGVGLALLGYRVILVDCDLGGADLHLFFDQLAPARTLGHFLHKDADSLNEVLLPTPHKNLKLVCGGNEAIGLANLPFWVKEKLIRHICKLEADFVLIDLGSGTSFNTLDFFTLAESGLIVCTPDPPARVDAYGFIKNTVYRKLRRCFAQNDSVKAGINNFARDSGRRNGRISELLEIIAQIDSQAGEMARAIMVTYRPRLVLNQIRHKRQTGEAYRFIGLVREYLSTEVEYVGHIRSDIRILEACERRRPLLIENPESQAALDLYRLLMKGLGIDDRQQRFAGEDSFKMAQAAQEEARNW